MHNGIVLSKKTPGGEATFLSMKSAYLAGYFVTVLPEDESDIRREAEKLADGGSEDVLYLLSDKAAEKAVGAVIPSAKRLILSRPMCQNRKMYPGGYEIRGYEGREVTSLFERQKIAEKSDGADALTKKSAKYIETASRLLDDNFKLTIKFVDKDKVSRYGRRLFRVLSRTAGKGTPLPFNGIFQGAVTEKGFLTYLPKITESGQSFVISDDNGGAGHMLLTLLQAAAKEKGIWHIPVYDTLSRYARLKGLIFHGCGILVRSSEERDGNGTGIDGIRFYNRGVAGCAQRTEFNRNAAAEMISEAAKIGLAARRLEV